MTSNPIKKSGSLGFPWQTQDPFLFCVYHHDMYPAGDDHLGPKEGLGGRMLGSDFEKKNGFRMYHGKLVPGFPAHPHRGFETITIAEKGLVDHADSLGATGRFGNGDIQWMTAGKGVQHSEMFPLLNQEEKNELLLFQIWLNLPSYKKMAEPHYKMLWNEAIPVIEKDGAKVKLVYGRFENTEQVDCAPDSWAAEEENQVGVFMISLNPGSRLLLPMQKSGVNRSLFFYEGNDLALGSEETDQHKYFALHDGVNCEISTKSGAKVLVLQGKPIKEKVVQQGPFVMNTEKEINDTLYDFQMNGFGGWPWPRPDFVHGREKGRFAQYANGEVENPA